jgi:hypothetical protein
MGYGETTLHPTHGPGRGWSPTRYEPEVANCSQQMRVKETRADEIETENKVLLNKLSYIWQSPGLTSNVLTTPMFPGGPFKETMKKKLAKTVKDNTWTVRDIEKSYRWTP